MNNSSKTVQNDPDRTKGVPFRVFLITAFVAFGGFLFGYECVIGGQLISTAKFRQDYGTIQPGTDKYGFSPALTGAFVSILSCGTFFGSLSASQFCDRLGRRWGIIVTCVIFSIGVIIQILSPNIAVLLTGRFVAGWGVGLVSVMIPLYQSECVPAHRRGTIVSCYQLAITIGLLIGQIVTNATKNDPTKKNYRIPIGLQLLWSTVLMCGMFFFPETPRFLIRAGKWEQAVAAKVRLSGLRADDPAVLDELYEIKGNLEHEMLSGPASYKQCFQGNNFRRTMLGIFMQAWQQLTGVNFIFYFGAMFFSSAGLGDGFHVGMIMGGVNCLFTFPGLYLVERVGRRKLLLWGACVQCASLFLVGICHVASKGKIPVLTAVFSGTFIAAFAASWGPCAWVITSELFGLKTRAKQMSFAVAGNWGFNTFLSQVSPLMSGTLDKPALGTNIAFIWGALNFGCWLYVYLFIPELRGLELEAVDELFDKKIPARRTVGWIPSVSYKQGGEELKTMDSNDSKDQGVVTERQVA